jgi:hypothetical protein
LQEAEIHHADGSANHHFLAENAPLARIAGAAFARNIVIANEKATDSGAVG